jgi:predicted Zn-dependent protease
LLCVASCTTRPPAPIVPAWNEPGSGASIEDEERALWKGAQEWRERITKAGLVVRDEALVAYLNRILEKLVVDLPEPVPEVWIVRSPRRTASSLPDGVILVTTSVLAALENEAQLAGLLGHELGHFVARHTLVRRRFARISRSTVERMELARQQETYGDRFAVAAMRQAGYDPREKPKLLLLVEADELEDGDAGYQLRSHPFIPERVRDLESVGSHPVRLCASARRATTRRSSPFFRSRRR